MIKRVLILGAGAAAGWLGHTAVTRVRRGSAPAETASTADTGLPSTLGRQVGSMAASALAAGAKGFASQLRSEVPTWRTVGEPRPGADTTGSQQNSRKGQQDAPTDGPQTADTDPEAERRAEQRRAAMQDRMRNIAAATDWRAVANAAASRDWRSAATTFINTGFSGPGGSSARGETIPGTVADDHDTTTSGENEQS